MDRGIHHGGITLKKPDFGTYHYCTPKSSEELRSELRGVYTQAFRKLPFSKNEKIKILDIGCGLGFLSCLCAEFFTDAVITGFDKFKDSSLKGSSIDKARENARILGFEHRIRFFKGDILHADFREEGIDLFVSNLVYHNLGRMRFRAYERLASWVTRDSYVVLGELFFGHGQDIERLSRLFREVNEVQAAKKIGGGFRLLILSDPR